MNVHSGNKKAQQKRDSIIQAATKLFVERGIQATSMVMLAKEAGVATGSIYTYFSSKEVLINSLFTESVNQEIDFILLGYNKNEDIVSRFNYIINRIINFMLADSERFKFMHIYTFSPVILEEIKAENCGCNHPLTEVLEQGKVERQIKQLEKEDLFFQIYGGLGALIHWKLFKQQQLNKHDIQQLVDMTWDAVRL